MKNKALADSAPLFFSAKRPQAHTGYDGSLPPSIKLNSISLWNLLRRKFPREIHVRIKRYSMEEVLQDNSWLDKKWAEKDRMLSYFARHQCFPPTAAGGATQPVATTASQGRTGSGSQSSCRYRVFDSRSHNVESSLFSLCQLLVLPSAVPVLLMLSVPLFWTLVWLWMARQAFRLAFGLGFDDDARSSGDSSAAGETGTEGTTPGSHNGTPYVPATPFASPSVTSWRDMFTTTASGSGGGGDNNGHQNGGSPPPAS